MKDKNKCKEMHAKLATTCLKKELVKKLKRLRFQRNDPEKASGCHLTSSISWLPKKWQMAV
jgi:hypothetical protein